MLWVDERMQIPGLERTQLVIPILFPKAWVEITIGTDTFHYQARELAKYGGDSIKRIDFPMLKARDRPFTK
jgi:hypothetical protein